MEKRILIVEDDRSVCQCLAQAMDNGTCEVVGNRTAQEALPRSLDESFDLMVLDLNVSDMDAWKAFAWFSRLHPFRPVVLLIEQPEQGRRGIQLGADACLEKPVDSKRLLQTVRRL